MKTATDHLKDLVRAIPAVSKPESASRYLGASCAMMQVYDEAQAFLADFAAAGENVISLSLDPQRLLFEQHVDRSAPIPIRIKVAKEDEQANAYYAPAADRLVASLAYAELLEKTAASQTPEAKAARESLRDAMALVDAEIVDAAAWTGWVCDGEEAYATSVEELVEHLVDIGGEPPAYCYTTEEKGFDFDLEGAIETYLMDEHHEDAECTHPQKLLDFYAEWKKGETVTTYWPAKAIIVIDQARFDAEIEAAKAVIAKEGAA